jgi:hypothetical protein
VEPRDPVPLPAGEARADVDDVQPNEQEHEDQQHPVAVPGRPRSSALQREDQRREQGGDLDDVLGRREL